MRLAFKKRITGMGWLGSPGGDLLLLGEIMEEIEKGLLASFYLIIFASSSLSTNWETTSGISP